MAGAGSASVASRELEAEILAIGRALAPDRTKGSLKPSRILDERAMRLAAEDRELRAALFRLIDVTPACRNVDDLGRHLADLVGEVPERPASIEAAMRLAHTKAGRMALGAATAAGVRHIAHRFIAGDSPRAAMGELGAMWGDGIGATLDLLGEASVTGEEADRYAQRCTDALDQFAEGAGAWPSRPVLEHDSVGPLPRVNLSVKVSALTPLLRAEAPERGVADAAVRLRPILRRARELDAHLHIDMEALDSLEATLALVLELLDEEEFRAGPSAGLVVQAYLRDSPAHLERVLAWAARGSRRPPLVIRLVKGAYWDHEVADARRHGWTVPVFTDKAESDRNFEALSRRLLEARPSVRVAIASHNLRSLAHAIAVNRLGGGADQDLELQVLRGLGDDLAATLAANGLRVRVYSAVGDLVAGMAYLVRRLLENTSNESFLAGLDEGAPLEQLLAPP